MYVGPELRKAEECSNEEAWQEAEESSSELDDEEEQRQNSEVEEEEEEDEEEEEGVHTQDDAHDHMVCITPVCLSVRQTKYVVRGSRKCDFWGLLSFNCLVRTFHVLTLKN